MDAPLDLYRASREELIALVLRQREQITDLEQRVARHEADLATLRATLSQLSERVGVLLAAVEPTPGDAPAGHPSGMPGLKPTSGRITPPIPARAAQAPVGRVWAPADAADGAPRPCLCPLPALPDGAAGRHGQTHA